MPSESDLRDFFTSTPAPGGLDAKRIISRSRARRLPKQIGAGAVGSLAVIGFGAVGVQSLQVATPISSMDQTAEAPVDTMESAAKRPPVEMVNLCGVPLAEVSPSFYGLQLDMVFPEAAATGTTPIEGAVRLTNTSDIRVVGTTDPVAAVTLSQDDITLWHSTGVMDRSIEMVDLAPGESLEYPATFTPVRCESDFDLEPGSGVELPPVPEGVYELSALIYFSPDASMPQTGTTELDLVSGPRSMITLG
ncbi:hypothetical protein BH10ACT7_BH10ACT7_26520 [soil metagenome]